MKQYFLLLFIFLCISLNAQEQEYCVVTFSETGRVWESRTVEYNWIMPINAIPQKAKTDFTIYPFITGNDELIKNYRERGDLNYYWIDFIHYPTRIRKEDAAIRILRKHRKKVQSFRVLLKESHRCIKVKVFITPIKGTIESKKSLWDDQMIYYSNSFQLWEELYQNDELLNKIQCYEYYRCPYYLP